MRTRERERDEVADEQRPLLAEADLAELDRPAREDADDRRDGELLPAARRQGQRLGQHERAEEEEGRRPQQRPEHLERVDLEPGRLRTARRCAAPRPRRRSRGRPRRPGPSRCARAPRARATITGAAIAGVPTHHAEDAEAGPARLSRVSTVAPTAAGLKMWRPLPGEDVLRQRRDGRRERDARRAPPARASGAARRAGCAP